MAKREVFDNAIAGPLMRRMHRISVDRAEGAQSMRDAVNTFQAGEMVGIFPEATISGPFEIEGDQERGLLASPPKAGCL
ncbi:MAG: 1-acyl-sn-glycerol-3-phosphate acyltransferase [Marmoricola sp.]